MDSSKATCFLPTVDGTINLTDTSIWSKIALWIRPPAKIRQAYAASLPVIVAMVMHRLYHIIDNRFVGVLGSDALLLHNIQFTFIVMGQFIGMATATSLLIFWNRPEAVECQRSVFKQHLILAAGAAVLFALILFPYIPWIENWYAIPEQLRPLAKIYLTIGIINMVLQTIASVFDGLLIASKKQHYAMVLALFLILGNFVADYLAVHRFATGTVNIPLLMIGLSTTALLLGFIAVGAYLGLRNATRNQHQKLAKIFGVWNAEFGIAVIRMMSPMVITFQLAYISASQGFLTTYNLALHLAYIGCLPLLGAAQIAVRDASRETGDQNGTPPTWWNAFAYSGLLPTVVILCLLSAISGLSFGIVYHYDIPTDHQLFVSVFFLTCLIGQIGHVFAVPLRAQKHSQKVTVNFLICELVILLGGNAVLLKLGLFTPASLALVFCLYTASYTFSNGWSAYRLRKQKVAT